MNKQVVAISIFICSMLFTLVNAQEKKSNEFASVDSLLFAQQNILPIKLHYSNKEIKKNTNDSTYIKSNLAYQHEDGSWDSLDIELRARGNFRLKNCYFPPIKLKIKKSKAKNTIFKGHKRLKMVLPCLIQKDNSDNIIKEYVAYKLFEIVSPYNFKTRLVDITFEEERGNKTKSHQLKGFLIEDDKSVAKRFNGKVYDRSVHPLQQDALTSIRHAFFQFMIGNTDFSQANQHNMKLIFIEKKITPVPYDFDMAGFVNCSYAKESQTNSESVLNKTSVTQRIYRGFKRDLKLFEQVKKEFIANKSKILTSLDECESLFDNANEFIVARDYITSFFVILSDNRKYQSEIVQKARTK